MSESKNAKTPEPSTSDSAVTTAQKHQSLLAHAASLGMEDVTDSAGGIVLPHSGGPPKSTDAS